MIANFAALEVRPGSMGKALPGVRAEIVKRDEDENAWDPRSRRANWRLATLRHMSDRLQRLRKAIAAAMSRSKREIPHY